MSTPLAVLIVEDSESDAQLIVRLLDKAGYAVVSQRVDTADLMRAALAKQTWDVVISDYNLPQFDGSAALTVLQSTGLDTPFIAVSGAMGEETAVAMMRAGARDYLMKGHLARLAPAVEREVAQAKVQVERRQAEAMLGASAQRHRTILQTAMDGFWLADTQGRLLEVNQTYCRMSGYSEQELLTKWICDLEVPESSAEVAAHIQKIMAQGEDRFESRHRRKDGTLFDVEVSAKYQFAEGGQFVVFLHDITEHKRREAEREKLEAQFLQAQKMESVGRLAGGVAHDFNNMLATILGNTELALRMVSPAQPLHACLEEIRVASGRSADLTRQLLAFARKQAVTPKVLDINQAVAATLKMLQRLIGEDVELKWRPGADLWPIEMDPSQIDQILVNLCVNARDAIADVGWIAIDTSNATFDDSSCADHVGLVPGEYVRLAVSDSGCGMDADTRTHVFEPFFTTKEPGKGTGLGLATVYGAVKQNRGLIDLSSTPGVGTTFTIYLPRHAGKVEQARPAPEDAALTVGTETILLVEDEPSILRLTARLLESLKYRVLAANSPGEAIRLAKQYGGRIDLVITDVVMPEMNGRTLAKALLGLNPRIKRLFMSGYSADVVTHHDVLDAGVPFIQKPFATAALAAKVRETLDAAD
jgi:PAS domain S-box-containing protein